MSNYNNYLNSIAPPLLTQAEYLECKAAGIEVRKLARYKLGSLYPISVYRFKAADDKDGLFEAAWLDYYR